MKVAACALNQTPLDWQGNLSRILSATEEARKQGAELILFPELCLSGYGCEDYFFMPWVYEKAKEILLTAILPASEGLLLAIGLPWHYLGRNYNTLAICQDGKLLGLYAKQILATRGVFYENRWFHPWPDNTTVELQDFPGTILGDFTAEWMGFRLGFEICEDAWHPDDRPAVRGAARKADIILNASASNFARGKLSERHQVVESLKGRNQAWYLYANLLGNESGNLIFDGELILGKAGIVLHSSPILSMSEWKLEVFELDENQPWPGARPAASDFEEFTAAASLGLKDYLRKSGSKGFTLSLSGGADSAACAVLVAEMLRRGIEEIGAESFSLQIGTSAAMKNLLCCVYQASKNSGQVTRQAAQQLAEALGAEFHCWEITSLIEEYTALSENSLGRNLSWEKDDLALQNIQARSRAPGIWMLSNLRNHLLITTGNRSEADVGYCTMDGDTAGSLAPIAGVSKHFIRQWLVWARDELNLPVLDLIIQQEPTAELRPGKQTDEGDLMPYELLEKIEIMFLKDRLSPDEILESLCAIRSESREYLEQNINKFLRLWKRSQWKRERLAPSFHLDRFNVVPRSMGRFPVFCG
jgi:NAD+ synthase (glutamine-hydrolysing)